MKSWKPEMIADSSGKWCGNGLRFATREEAEANVFDLSMRWFLVRETRVVESDDPVNYALVDGRLVAVETDKEEQSKPCSICGGPIDVQPLSGWAGGHNAEPVNSGRCCTNCNTMVVLPARLQRLRRNNESSDL